MREKVASQPSTLNLCVAMQAEGQGGGEHLAAARGACLPPQGP